MRKPPEMIAVISQRRRPPVATACTRPALTRQPEPERNCDAIHQAGNNPLGDNLVEDVTLGAVDDVVGQAVEPVAAKSLGNSGLAGEDLERMAATEERERGMRRMQDRSLACSWPTESSARCFTELGSFCISRWSSACCLYRFMACSEAHRPRALPSGRDRRLKNRY